MTPKAKAKELYDKYLPWVAGADRYSMGEIHHPYIAKQCAIITVKEIAEVLNQDFGVNTSIKKEYWNEVKTEIEAL